MIGGRARWKILGDFVKCPTRRKSTVSAIKLGVLRSRRNGPSRSRAIDPPRGSKERRSVAKSYENQYSSRKSQDRVEKYQSLRPGHATFSQGRDGKASRGKMRPKTSVRYDNVKEGSTQTLLPRCGPTRSTRDKLNEELLDDEGFRAGLRRPVHDDGPVVRRAVRPTKPSVRDTTTTTPSRETRMPTSIPYTAADSEFLYGNSVVIAALTARQRELRKLYIHPRATPKAADAAKLRSFASRSMSDQDVHFVSDEWLPKMDKMSGGRPHNGIVLEASSLPKTRVLALSPIEIVTAGYAKSFHLVSSHSKTKPTDTTALMQIDNISPSTRQPFILLIDDVLDPGNLGAIIRSAYFLGIDAVAMVNNTCAPLTNVALKASAGAAEALKLLSVDDAAGFLKRSRRNGWRVYAGVTPEEVATKKPRSVGSALGTGKEDGSRAAGVQITEAGTGEVLGPEHSPLTQAPCVLIIGGEGRGVRRVLRAEADYAISLEAARRRSDVGVDSLNVSVAAAVLASEMIRRAETVNTRGETLETGEVEGAGGKGDLGFENLSMGHG